MLSDEGMMRAARIIREAMADTSQLSMGIEQFGCLIERFETSVQYFNECFNESVDRLITTLGEIHEKKQ